MRQTPVDEKSNIILTKALDRTEAGGWVGYVPWNRSPLIHEALIPLAMELVKQIYEWMYVNRVQVGRQSWNGLFEVFLDRERVV